MTILTAHKYPSARNGPLSHAEKETRRLCYAIKSTSSSLCDFHTAAAAMAPLISGPCWLVPIPSSTGNTDANTQLASMIARLVSTPEAPVQVVKAIARTQGIASQCERHKHALGAISREDHNFVRTGKYLTLRQTYFVDNVTTSGHTLEAARMALGCGTGLVFADAASGYTQRQASFF